MPIILNDLHFGFFFFFLANQIIYKNWVFKARGVFMCGGTKWILGDAVKMFFIRNFNVIVVYFIIILLYYIVLRYINC